MQEVLNEYHSEKVIRAAGIGKDRAVVEKDVAVNRMEVSSNPVFWSLRVRPCSLPGQGGFRLPRRVDLLRFSGRALTG